MTQPRHRATTARDRHARTGVQRISRHFHQRAAQPAQPETVQPVRSARASRARRQLLAALALTLTPVTLVVTTTTGTTTASPSPAENSLRQMLPPDLVPNAYIDALRDVAVSRSASRSAGASVEASVDVHRIKAREAAAEKRRQARIAAARKEAARKEAARKAAVARKEAARKAAVARKAAQAQQAAARSEQESAEVVALPPGSLKATARQMMLDYGYGPEQWAPLDALITRESGWNPLAQNPSSGAYGLPQSLPGDKMASHGADWRTNPRTQLAWMLDYIRDRYGSPASAWGHSQSVGWY